MWSEGYPNTKQVYKHQIKTNRRIFRNNCNKRKIKNTILSYQIENVHMLIYYSCCHLMFYNIRDGANIISNCIKNSPANSWIQVTLWPSEINNADCYFSVSSSVGLSVKSLKFKMTLIDGLLSQKYVNLIYKEHVELFHRAWRSTIFSCVI